MKRTRETIFREHPPADYRNGVSGLKEFDGEDLCIILSIKCKNKNLTHDLSTIKIFKSNGFWK